MAFISSVPLLARPAYIWYLRAQMLEGVFIGAVFQMIQFVGRKTIGVGELEISLFNFFLSFGMFASFLVPTLLNLRSQKQYVLWTSVPSKIVFIFLALLTEPALFFAIASLAFVLLKMQDPMRTSLLKTNFPASHRFRIVSHVRMMEFLCMMVASTLAGILLDRDGDWFRVVFPVGCVIGITGTWMFVQLREEVEEIPQKVISIRRFLRVMKEDKVYMKFQFLFSISGMANLMGLPLYVLYTVDVIQANYTEIAISKGVLYGIASMICMKWWGNLMDRYPNPILMRAILSLLWCLHPLCYAAAWDMTMIYVAEAWFGFIFAGGQLNWMLGPLFFCSDKDAPLYTTIHSFMNGLRGMIAPVMGYLLYIWIGFIPTFIVISIILLLNSISIYLLYIKTKDLERFQYHAELSNPQFVQ